MPLDWSEYSPGDKQDYDWVHYGEAHGQKAQVQRSSTRSGTRGIVPRGTQSIGTWLLQLNRPRVLAAGHRTTSIGQAGHAYLLRQFATESGAFRL
jgi:hypothetical protein